jgi:hypothetical protein
MRSSDKRSSLFFSEFYNISPSSLVFSSNHSTNSQFSKSFLKVKKKLFLGEKLANLASLKIDRMAP